ncbi:MAG: protein kinase [Deltaproteobacteria bacterium]|nr:protein kinase [Deltaproteobacteria bacterium]
MSGEASFQSGSLLAGKYRVLQLLGQGGMGAVYLAENVDIGRQVAIKVLKPELAADPGSLARFKQEARAAASIGHPGIVEVLDMGMLPEGGAFIVMERLEGQTLREHLARQGSMSPWELSQVVGSVLDTLVAAHDKGVIHRDLKPDNIFLVERPVAATKILDFGISKFRGSGDVALTRTGMVMGTPLYMSPEQARGARDVGVTADIYSVGAILYEALSGQPPFPGESYNEVLAKVLMDQARPLGQIRADAPPALCDLVESMLAKDATRRPQTARDAAMALRASVDASSPPPRGTSNTAVRPQPTPAPNSKPAFQTGPKLPPPAAMSGVDVTFTPAPGNLMARSRAPMPSTPGLSDTVMRPENPGARAETQSGPNPQLAPPAKSKMPLIVGVAVLVIGALIAGIKLGGGSALPPAPTPVVTAPTPPVPAKVEPSAPVAVAPKVEASLAVVPDAGVAVAVPAKQDVKEPTPTPAAHAEAPSAPPEKQRHLGKRKDSGMSLKGFTHVQSNTSKSDGKSALPGFSKSGSY